MEEPEEFVDRNCLYQALSAETLNNGSLLEIFFIQHAQATVVSALQA